MCEGGKVWILEHRGMFRSYREKMRDFTFIVFSDTSRMYVHFRGEGKERSEVRHMYLRSLTKEYKTLVRESFRTGATCPLLAPSDGGGWSGVTVGIVRPKPPLKVGTEFTRNLCQITPKRKCRGKASTENIRAIHHELFSSVYAV